MSLGPKLSVAGSATAGVADTAASRPANHSCAAMPNVLDQGTRIGALWALGACGRGLGN